MRIRQHAMYPEHARILASDPRVTWYAVFLQRTTDRRGLPDWNRYVECSSKDSQDSEDILQSMSAPSVKLCEWLSSLLNFHGSCCPCRLENQLHRQPKTVE